MNKGVKTWWWCHRINPLLSLTGIVLSVLVPQLCRADTVTTLPYAVSQTVGWLPNPVATNTLTGLVSNGPAIFSIDQYPAHGVLGQQPGFSTNGQWTYQPFSTNFFVTDYFLFGVADTNGHVSVPGLVTIMATNQPYAFSESVAWLRGTSPTNTLRGYVAAGPTNFIFLFGPTNGTLVSLPGFSTNGQWQYQPSNTPVFSGADSFTFAVTDSLGNSSTSAVVSIFMTNLPYANSQAVGWMQGTFPTNRLTGGVVSGLTITNFSIVQNPLYGQITLSPGFVTNGLWKFKPYATNFFGTDSFTFKIQDSHGSNSPPGLISITVTNMTAAPYAHYQYLKTRPGKQLAISLSGDDDGNDPLFPTNFTQVIYAHTRDMHSWNPVFTVLTFPTNGTLTGTAPNLIYTPSQTNVFDSFTFKVNNGTLDSPPATVMIKVATYNIGTNYFDPNFSANMTNSYQTNDVPLANSGTVRPGFEGAAFSSSNGTVLPDYAGTPTASSDRTDDGCILVTNFMDRLKRPKLFNFFGTSFTNFYIDNNGLLSFQSAVSNYLSTTFPSSLGVPIMAPLWQDVDTRGGAGAVTYGLGYVTDSLDGAPGRPALIITWPDVGSYSAQTNPLNRFQITLIDRSDINVGDFDVEFNYEYIHWLYGSASGSTYPAAGFDKGDGVYYYNLPGANTTNALNFPTNSNMAVPGRFALHVNGDSIEPFCENIAVTSVGTTNALLSAQFGANPFGTNSALFFVSNTVSGVTTNIFAGHIPPTGAGLVQLATNFGDFQSGTRYYVNAYAMSPYGSPLGNTTVFPGTSTYFSTVPRLVSLVPNLGTLTPAFNPNITSYSLLNLNNPVFMVTLASDEPGDLIAWQFNGSATVNLPSGTTTAPLTLSYGVNLLNLMVISSYGFTSSLTNIYTVVITFTAPPTLATEPVTSISSSNATLNAQVTPGGSATTTYFEWGPTSAYGSTNVVAAQGSSGTMPVSVTLSNLAVYTGYHYQVVASNSAGMTNSGDLTFTTSAGAPLVTTTGTNNITGTGATLLGSVNPEGAASGWYFKYGPTTGYGSFTATNSIAAGSSSVPVSAVISGLSPATTYHFVLVATNSAGSGTGGDLVFQTPGVLPPALIAEPVTSISSSNATLNAQVNPNGSPTTVCFKWGTASSYGSTNIVAAGSSSAPVPLSDTLSNLALYTIYHYQIVASNTIGTASSGDLTFTSAYSPLTVLNWWRLGEADANAVPGGTSTNTIDGAGSENLTVYGGATYSTNVSAAAAGSVSSSLAMCFTNGSSYAGGGYAPTSVNTNFGFEMWVYTISASDNPTLFYNGDTGGNGWGLGEIGSSYRILFGGVVFAPVGTVIPNTWTHIAVVCQNGTATLYTNGIAAGSVAAVPNPPAGLLSIAGDPGGAGNDFDGLIDEVRIFTFSTGAFSTNYLLLNLPAGPVVSGVTAMNISTNGATLNATIAPNAPNGAGVGAWFEYGLTTNYGALTATNTVPAGSAQSVSHVVAGLDPGTLYHFRADALGLSLPVQSGTDQTFVTLDVPRTLSTLPQTAGGQFSFQFVGGPSVSYTILGTTNLTLPASNWTILGTPFIVSNNIYQFTDPSATNGSQYYMLKNP